MAGAICPHCGKPNFFTLGGVSKCTACGCMMTIPPLNGQGGKGQKCPNCKRYTVFKDRCFTCGATFTFPEKEK